MNWPCLRLCTSILTLATLNAQVCSHQQVWQYAVHYKYPDGSLKCETTLLTPNSFHSGKQGPVNVFFIVWKWRSRTEDRLSVPIFIKCTTGSSYRKVKHYNVKWINPSAGILTTDDRVYMLRISFLETQLCFSTQPYKPFASSTSVWLLHRTLGTRTAQSLIYSIQTKDIRTKDSITAPKLWDNFP